MTINGTRIANFLFTYLPPNNPIAVIGAKFGMCGISRNTTAPIIISIANINITPSPCYRRPLYPCQASGLLRPPLRERKIIFPRGVWNNTDPSRLSYLGNHKGLPLRIKCMHVSNTFCNCIRICSITGLCCCSRLRISLSFG